MSLKIYLTKEREDKIIRPRYEPTTGEFLGLYVTIGFIIVRWHDGKHFVNYGYNENKSKLLYSIYNSRIPICFGGTMLVRYQLIFKSGEFDTDFSKLFFFFFLA